MKAPALLALGQRLREQTGIDFANYRNQALFDTIAELLIFPRYAARLILGPLVALELVVVLIGGYWYFESRPGLAILTWGLGGVGALVNGLLWGMVRFAKQLAHDVDQIGQLTTDTAARILTDCGQLGGQASLGQLPKLSEVALGTVYLVLLPGISKAMERKLPLLGGPISSLINTVVGALAQQVADRLDAGQAKVAEAVGSQVDQRAQTLRQYAESGTQKIGKAVAASSGFASGALRVAAFPFRLALWICAPLTGAGLGLLWWLG